jgi:hypothetical protein
MKRILFKPSYLKYLLLLLPFLSILYLIPSFTIKYNNKFYYFNNFPSLGNSSNRDLVIDIPKFSETFRYEIESVNEITSDEEWNRLVSDDQKTLERRVESYLESNNYEIRLDKNNNRAVFSIFTTKNIGANTIVFTQNNSEFRVTSTEAAVTATQDPSQLSDANKTDLKLGRGDFGIADIKTVPDQQSNQLTYQVRLPLGIVGPEKIKTINEKVFSTINITVGGKEYQANFLTNTNNVVTHLVITGVESVDEAFAVKTFLNTDPYKLGYEFNRAEVISPKYGVYKLAGLVILFFVSGYLISRFLFAQISLQKLMLILGVMTTGLGFSKLIGVDITNGYVLLLAMVGLMSLLNVRNVYFITIAVVLLLIRLLGYLYFLQLTPLSVIVIIVISLLIWGINYVKKS